jgi:tetratricopeptide (TPR) repeat protein
VKCPILEAFSEYEEAVAAYQQALELVRQVRDRRSEVDILSGLSGVYNTAHRGELAATYSEQALALAQELDDPSCLAACLTQRAVIRWVAGGQIVDATPDAEKALQIAREIGDPKLLSQSLLFLGGILQWRADFKRAIAYLHEGLELTGGMSPGARTGASCIAWAYEATGAYEDALRWYEVLTDYASKSGDKYAIVRVPNYIGGVHLELFDFDEALRLNLESDELCQRLWPWTEPRGHALVKAGLAYLYQDELDRAKDHFRRAEALLEEDTWMRWRWHIVLLRAWGELALIQNRHDEAWTYANQSLELAVQSDSRKHMARAQWLQGKVLIAGGRLEEAVQMLRTSIHLAEQIGTPRELWMGKAAQALALMQLDKDEEAEMLLTQAAQTIEAIVADLQTPRLRNCFLNAAPVVEIYHTLGRRPPTMTA